MKPCSHCLLTSVLFAWVLYACFFLEVFCGLVYSLWVFCLFFRFISLGAFCLFQAEIHLKSWMKLNPCCCSLDMVMFDQGEYAVVTSSSLPPSEVPKMDQTS